MSRKNNVIGVVLAVVVLSGLPWGGQARADLIDNMEGYWQFDNPGNRGEDSTPNNRDLTIVGSPSFTTGLSGQALDLPKDNSKYAQRAIDDAAFDFGSGAFTIQIWANYYDTAGIQVLIEKFVGAGGPGWTLAKLDGSSFSFFATSGMSQGLGAGTITPGVWHQLVVRRNSTVLQMFLDGNEVFSQPLGIGVIDNVSSGLLIGKRNDGDGRDLSTNAKLDEIAIWSRALTDSEVDTLFLLGKAAAPIPEPGSVFLLAAGATALLRRRRRR